MNSEKLNNWLTLGANIGVLAGIVFLVYELQQNTLATQLDVASNFQNSFTEIEMLIAGDPEFSELLIKGRESQDISPADQLRLSVFYSNVLRQWQFVHFQYLSNALDEEIWDGQRAYFDQVLDDDLGLFEHWKMSKDHYSLRFNDLLQSMTTEH
ncbi:MAG: hypothetical protein COA96_16205 [SAR86 cluster bacterium]|uniref:DUF4760 domain-containing protein n=1 Tax=SAR86 cluster bacterium TaxID=2030880 RepID=A0A2A5AK40_9GAMM|nr:MAG: hypothetical protein COA96_16205 [SAR86 cluster bacterium]